MVTPPDEYDSGRWHVGAYVPENPSNARDFDIRRFDTADVDLDEVFEDADVNELVQNNVARGVDPRFMEPGTLAGVFGFDVMARRGWQIARSTFSPGVSAIKDAVTDGDGNLTITPDDGWTLAHPRAARKLSEGDLLYAVTNGQVQDQQPSATIYGWPAGTLYAFRPQGVGDIATSFYWDEATETISGRGDDGTEPVFTTYAIQVYLEDPQDPIYGLKPGTDEGPTPAEPYTESDFPPGFDLDPFFQSQDDVSALVGEEVLVRTTGGQIYEAEVRRELTDAAGVKLTYNVDLELDYIIPASSKHDERDCDIVAVPADNPFRAQTTDLQSYIRENVYTEEGTTWDIGGFYEPGEQVPAGAAVEILTFAREGDRFQVKEGGSGIPSGEMVALEDGKTGGTVVVSPVSGSKAYLLQARDQDLQGLGQAPMRLRERDGNASVGRVERITFRRGDSPTGEDGEDEDMSGNPTERQVAQRYESLGITEEEVMDAIRDMGLPEELTDYDGIGPSRAQSLNDFAINSPADLGVMVRPESEDKEAFGPLSFALDELNRSGRQAVMEAGETIRDLAVQGAGGDAGGRQERDVFPLEARVDWVGDTVEYRYQTDIPNPADRIDSEVLESLTETFELIWTDESRRKRNVATVVFTGPEDYNVTDRDTPLDLRPAEDFDTTGFALERDPTGTDPDFVVEAPDGTIIGAFGNQVFAYPTNASPSALTSFQDQAVKLNVSPDTLEKKVRDETGFEIVRENRPDKMEDVPEAGESDRPGIEVPEPDPDDAPEVDREEESTRPTILGLRPADLREQMESVMLGTDAIAQVDGDEVLIGWEESEAADVDVARTSAVLTGDPTIAGQLLQQVTRAYYDNAALDSGMVNAIERAVEEADVDFPQPPTSGGREQDTGDSPPSDAGSGGGSTPSPSADEPDIFSDSALQQARAALNDILPSDGGAAPRGVSDRDVIRIYEPLEQPVVEATGGLVEGLAVEQESNMDGTWIGSTVEARFAPQAQQTIAGFDIFQPIEVSVPPGEEPQRLADIVAWVNALRSDEPGNEEVAERLGTMEDVTDNRFRRGAVDLDNMFLTAQQIRSFARHLPETYDVSLLNYLSSIDRTYFLAQLGYAADTGGDQFGEALRDRVDQFRAGSPGRAVGDEVIEAVQDGTFDPIRFAREFWRVAEGARNRGDIIEETQREQEEARASLGRSQTEELIDQPGGVEVEFIRQPGLGRFGVQPVTTDGDIALDVGNGDVETALLFLDGEVNIDAYSEGELIGVGIIDGDDLADFSPSPRDTTPAETVEPDQDTDTSSTTDPTPSDPPSRTPERGTRTPGSDREEPPSTPLGEQGGGETPPPGTNIGEANIESFDAEEVTIEDLDIDIGGDASFNVDRLDMDRVDDIARDIEDDIDS